jgi:hypothetical protein
MRQPQVSTFRIAAILLTVLIGLGGTCLPVWEISPSQARYHIALSSPATVRERPANSRAVLQPSDDKLVELFILASYLGSNSER